MIRYSEFRKQQQKFLSRDGNISYIDKGKSSKVIVLLHGVPTSGWLYRNMIDALSKEYRVIAPDMLGFGNSDNPSDYKLYHEKTHAKRLLALMNHLKIKDWTHVFHDAGGLWTWELLKLEPNRISKLVILNTIIYKEGFKPPVKFRKNRISKAIIGLYKSKLFNSLLLNALFKQGANVKIEKETFLGYKQPLLEGKINGMYHFFSKTKQLPNYKELLRTLNIPAMVVWGKNDSFLKWKPQAEAVISDLKIKPEYVHILEGTHFIQEETPEKITELILEFQNI